MVPPHKTPLYNAPQSSSSSVSLSPPTAPEYLALLEQQVLGAAAAAVTAVGFQAPLPSPPLLLKIVVPCPRWMVGRLIGKNGSTIKGIQLATNAVVEVDQLAEPTQVTIVGEAAPVRAAEYMVSEIIAGRFRGFAPVQDFLESCTRRPGSMVVYAPGLGVLVSRDVSK